jgi:hypothetical protein
MDQHGKHRCLVNGFVPGWHALEDRVIPPKPFRSTLTPEANSLKESG